MALRAHSTTTEENTCKKTKHKLIKKTSSSIWQHMRSIFENTLQRPQWNTLEKSDANRPQHNGSVSFFPLFFVSRGLLKVMHTSGHVCCWRGFWVTALLKYFYLLFITFSNTTDGKRMSVVLWLNFRVNNKCVRTCASLVLWKQKKEKKGNTSIVLRAIWSTFSNVLRCGLCSVFS